MTENGASCPPFISQHSLREEWAYRGCGLVSLKMVLDHWNLQDERNRTIPMEELLRSAILLGAYREGVGWSHVGLVEVAKSLGYDAFNRDLPKERPEILPDDSFPILAEDTAKGPVLVSMWKNYDPEQKGGHIVVVYRIEKDRIFILDPEKQSEQEGKVEFLKKDFLSGYKMRSICVMPK